jgi:cyclase
MKTKIMFVCIVAAVLFADNTFGQRQEAQPVEFKKISDRLYEITGGRGANGGVYIGDTGVLVVDAKMDKESVENVIEGIKKLTDKPIKFLVNTHSDGDHINGNQYFPETVTIVAHENCRKDFFLPGRNGAESQWKKPELAPFVPSVTFTENMVLYLSERKVELWYFGVGHTTGDIVVNFPEEKVAFLGDQVFLTRPQLIHSYKNGNSFEHIKTLAKMLETLDAEKFCSGHSEMTDRDGIKKQIEKTKKLQEKVKTLIGEGKSLEQIKVECEENQDRLVDSIYNEIKNHSQQ